MPSSLRAVILLAGTNNLEANSPLAVCAGIQTLIKKIRAERPGLLVGVLAVLPRQPGPFACGLSETELMTRVNTLNRGLQSLAAQIPRVVYEDASCWHELCDSSSSRKGLMNKQFFADYVHLNRRGYRVLADAILRLIQRLRGMSRAEVGAQKSH